MISGLYRCRNFGSVDQNGPFLTPFDNVGPAVNRSTYRAAYHQVWWYESYDDSRPWQSTLDMSEGALVQHYGCLGWHKSMLYICNKGLQWSTLVGIYHILTTFRNWLLAYEACRHGYFWCEGGPCTSSWSTSAFSPVCSLGTIIRGQDYSSGKLVWGDHFLPARLCVPGWSYSYFAIFVFVYLCVHITSFPLLPLSP